MDLREIVSISLTVGLAAMGCAMALGLGAGNTVAGRRYNRKLGVAVLLLGVGNLVSDIPRWVGLSLLGSVPLWVLSIIMVGGAIYLLVTRPTKRADGDD